ncbi:unnamed protein product [Cuscuta campestris]|uniref:SWIM-type domain-containing protein n=1 Tax=Cuscuta campestris TaxID=132261 RepID=A0A484M3Z0_9ASTE|nr:unnamed protein product [Cuscuta campestris]
MIVKRVQIPSFSVKRAAKTIGSELKDLLWDCARASYPARLLGCLKLLEDKCPEAREWLKARPTKNWSRAEFSTFPKCDMLTNNLSESFNKYILDAREKPILIMLEMIRTKLMKRLATKKKVMDNVNDTLCPKIRAKVAQNTEHAHMFIPTFSGGSKYQVEGPGGLQYVVDLATQTCGCRRWDLTGTPCSHAIACILDNNEDPDLYTDKQYLVSNYLQLYSHYINPVNMMEMWPNDEDGTPIIPPADPPKKKGKKQRARRKQPEEVEGGNDRENVQAGSQSQPPTSGAGDTVKLSRKGTVKMKCTVCGQIGHNKRSHAQKDTIASTQQEKGQRQSSRKTGKKKRKASTPNGPRKRNSAATSVGNEDLGS